MGKFIDISGMKFGKLTVISKTDLREQRNILWDCLCDCGNKSVVNGSSLRSGNTKSCGCWRSEATILSHTTHGHAKASGESRIYMVWSKMIGRCHSITNKDYKYYGARGIKVCNRWHSFENFLADMGEPEVGMTLERKENNKNYDPLNCRWATRIEQANNVRSNVMIKTTEATMTMSQFSKMTGINYDHIRHKVKRGIKNINGIEISVFRRGDIK